MLGDASAAIPLHGKLPGAEPSSPSCTALEQWPNRVATALAPSRELSDTDQDGVQHLHFS